MKEDWGHELPGVESRWAANSEIKKDLLNKPLIINVAPSGTHVSREMNPNQPYYPEEILKELKETYALGASMWHIHVRDKKTGKASVDPVLMAETMSAVKAECEGIIVSAHLDHDMDATDRGLFTRTVESLAKVNSLPDTVILHVASRTSRKVFEEGLVDQVKYLQEMGLKPELNGQSLIGLDNVKRWLIDKNVLAGRIFLTHNLGKHETVPLSFEDPMWNYIMTMSMLKMYPPNSANAVVGLHAGGRWWLPITVLGIMNGVDEVRVGMEDVIYMHPHSEEKVKNNRALVESVTTIATRLGRSIATPQQARNILGLPAKKK